MAEIPEQARHLFQGRHIGHVATILPDGSPHTTPVWIALEGDKVLFNTVQGRLKERNLRRDPRVAISVFNLTEPDEKILVRGIAQLDTEGGEQNINALSKRYYGVEPFPFLSADAVRVIVRVTPERVSYTPPPG